MPTLHLPRTRTWRRRGWRPWGAALGVGLLANALVAAALAHLARDPDPVAPPAPLARRIQRVPAPPPPDPVAVPAAVAAAAPAAAPLTPLPALALPAPTAVGPTLPPPALPPPRLPVLAAEPVAGPAEEAAGAPAASGVPGDRPAQRDGLLATARYYPAAARRRGVGGCSRLRLEIDAAGRVAAAAVLASEPTGVFDAAAQRLARDLRYRPALRQGRAAPCTVHLLIDWTPP